MFLYYVLSVGPVSTVGITSFVIFRENDINHREMNSTSSSLGTCFQDGEGEIYVPKQFLKSAFIVLTSIS